MQTIADIQATHTRQSTRSTQGIEATQAIKDMLVIEAMQFIKTMQDRAYRGHGAYSGHVDFDFWITQVIKAMQFIGVVRHLKPLGAQSLLRPFSYLRP